MLCWATRNPAGEEAVSYLESAGQLHGPDGTGAAAAYPRQVLHALAD
jgi:hypothetical protein